jgi:hypothetical protein
MSRLRFGSLDANSPDYDSLADFFVRENRIELRIPWGLINVTDPSSKKVLWLDRNGMTKETAGVRLLAVSYKPEEGLLVASRTGRTFHHTDSLPRELEASHIKTYAWEGWDTPIYHTYLKESYFRYRQILQAIPEG